MSDYPTTLPPNSLVTVGEGTTALAAPLVEEPVAPTVEFLEVTELWRRCEAADREVTALRQLLAQGRPVTDADLARVSGLIRGEARGVWLGRPPTLDEGRDHIQKHGEEPALVLVCGNGSMWMASATDTYPLAPGTGGPDLGIIDVALAAGEAHAREVAQARWEQEKAQRA